MSLKTLLIGCGNIGAQYDIEDPNRTWTHARAFVQHPNIELTVVDQEYSKAEAVANRYGAQLLPSIEAIPYQNFDIISITTPTTTHAHYLKASFIHAVPVVICEKPVVSSLEEIADIEDTYKAGRTKVVVNYMRSFQPAYRSVKEYIANNLLKEQLKGTIIKYKRGFLNNASHAVNLLEYLFDEPFLFDDLKVQAAFFDAFPYDPTITGTCMFLQAPVNFAGITGVDYAIFELELFFPDQKIMICHSGNDIRFYKHRAQVFTEDVAERQTNVLQHYMMPIVDHAIELFYNRSGVDNFISCLRLNERMLTFIENLNVQIHVV